METIRCHGCMNLKTQAVCEHCGYDEKTQNAPHQLPAGTVLKEQYLIGRTLGQGGFGITYLGWDLYLDMPVAIKEYYPSSTVMRDSAASLSVASYGGEVGARFRNCKERFLREAKILARLSEVPEIVKILNFFESNNTAYIVMEFVRGVTLKDYVKSRGGKIAIEETLSILSPVMEGLCKVHRAGLVHRDISPDNIMILPGGNAKLIDFGAVRDVGQADKEAPLTKSTETILKQGYAPIEQYQNRGSLGPWTDVYAMCATIFYCVTGQVPLDAPGRMLDEEDLQIQQLAPELPESMVQVLEHGMALRTVNRIASMEDLRAQLRNPRQETEPVPTPAIPATEAPKKKKKPLIFAAVVAAALGAVFLLPKVSSDPTVTTPPVQNAVDPGQTTQQEETSAPFAIAMDSDRWEDHILQKVSGTYQTIEEYAEMDVFQSSLKRKEIASVTFLDSVESIPDSAWDVSEAKNESVMAWTVPNGALYDLYIAASGGVGAPESCDNLFAGYINMESIMFHEALYLEQTTSIRFMFFGCRALREVSMVSLDTTNVTDMSGMFSGCAALTTVEWGRPNTDNVENMSQMFEDCSGLIQLDLKRLKTPKVTNMEKMFSGCSNLREVDLTSFDTALVTNMSFMFYRCCSLEDISFAIFVTDRVETMESMFECCCSLTELDFSGATDSYGTYLSFDTWGIGNMRRVFADCVNLKQINGPNISITDQPQYDFDLEIYRVQQDITDIILNCPHLALVNITLNAYTIVPK